ncbi:protein ROOT HAIR DEFECTIVE 3-like [Bidens hawaiensis]|uniref:protein ROOT HAIR DEFECTIVE 3-like n=1 Tax=Bidens hawaiensis TaxID=980011 RepID=UPI004049309C
MDGNFKVAELDNFIKQVKLVECELSYVIVSVMGRQSSGKSTLLNNLFHTKFIEMDADRGRYQTTKGIWIARCPSIVPCTIVMDLEGTDGRERGEDDTKFEKQSALFAIAVSDIVLINMWCLDIGSEHAANIPLLRIVFMVMLKLCRPHKTTLMFVLRDKTTTPFDCLADQLRDSIKNTWDSVPKAKAHKHTQLDEYFNVEVVALDHYEFQREKFEEQVANLRQKFSQSIAPGGLAADRRGAVPASAFCFSAQEMWKVIKENKELNLLSHKLMVARVLCEDIANEKFSSFAENKDWLDLEMNAKSHLVRGFEKMLKLLLDNCLSSYDEEAEYFDGNFAYAQRKKLHEKLKELIRPTIKLMLKYIQSEVLHEFETALNNALHKGQRFTQVARDCTDKCMIQFDKLCEDATKLAGLDSTKLRNTFSSSLNSYTANVRDRKLRDLPTQYENKIKQVLCGPVERHLKEGSDGTWRAITSLLNDETKKVVIKLSSALAEFEIDEQDKEQMILNLKSYARQLVVEKTNEMVKEVVPLMNQRLRSMFVYTEGTKKQDIEVIASKALKSVRIFIREYVILDLLSLGIANALKLLSVLAAICLDGDNNTIFVTLDGIIKGRADSSTWEGVSATNTLISPSQCKLIWEQVLAENMNIRDALVSVSHGDILWKRVKLVANVSLLVGGIAVGITGLCFDPTGTVTATSVVAVSSIVTDVAKLAQTLFE